jgi:hypothetical protein
LPRHARDCVGPLLLRESAKFTLDESYGGA